MSKNTQDKVYLEYFLIFGVSQHDGKSEKVQIFLSDFLNAHHFVLLIGWKRRDASSQLSPAFSQRKLNSALIMRSRSEDPFL